MKGRGFEIAKGWEERGVNLPVRSTKQAAGYDFFAADDVTIEPGKIELVPTGIKAYMQPDEVLLLFNRSGVPRKMGLILANGTGVIDADYYGNPENDGHIMFQYWNLSDKTVTIKKGYRIGQGMFTHYLQADNANETQAERKGGFGSTGI